MHVLVILAKSGGAVGSQPAHKTPGASGPMAPNSSAMTENASTSGNGVFEVCKSFSASHTSGGRMSGRCESIAQHAARHRDLPRWDRRAARARQRGRADMRLGIRAHDRP
eukprot:scaffold5647_cov100-Isochrysis_galbana.AAC.3